MGYFTESEITEENQKQTGSQDKIGKTRKKEQDSMNLLSPQGERIKVRGGWLPLLEGGWGDLAQLPEPCQGRLTTEDTEYTESPQNQINHR